ncbi:DUF1492 domain-containing protein [Lachnospiraceae bacterium 50-23]
MQNQKSNIRSENDRKKEYLWSYRKHGRRIKRIEAEIEEIRSMKMHPSQKGNDGMPRGSSGQADLSGYIAEIKEKEDKLYAEGVKQVEIYKEIHNRIDQMENEDERDVLFYRYIKGMNWWDVAQNIGLSERRVYEIHGKALKNLNIS